MRYFFKSILTQSFWKYALFSSAGAAGFLACMGCLYLFMEIMDFLNIYTKDKYSKLAIVPVALVSFAYVLISRRPLTRFIYKLPGRDVQVEVKIADLFAESGNIVVSTNTTFDTDISSGIISPDSLQGQFALKYFHGNTASIDQQISSSLSGVASTERAAAVGKTAEFPMGTVAKVTTGSQDFYMLAMSRLNQHGNAASTIRDLEDALSGLWQFAAAQGELRPIAMAVVGTGRGRVDASRKKVIERIVQSFSDASSSSTFCNRLSLIVRPEDADNFNVNLFEIRDYLIRSVH